MSANSHSARVFLYSQKFYSDTGLKNVKSGKLFLFINITFEWLKKRKLGNEKIMYYLILESNNLLFTKKNLQMEEIHRPHNYLLRDLTLKTKIHDNQLRARKAQ